MTLEQLIADYMKQRDALYNQAEQQAAASNFSRGQAMALEKIIEDLKTMIIIGQSAPPTAEQAAS